jgi:thiol-disulfide isomerase/thioredoxin
LSRLAGLLLCLGVGWAAAGADSVAADSVTTADRVATDSVTTADETDIAITVHSAEGKQLFLWLPSEAGPQPADERISGQLAAAGIEVWSVDLVEARFLPQTASSVDQVPAGDVAALLQHAQRSTDKQLFVVANGRSVIPALRGLRAWQLQSDDQSRLGGLILLSPKLFVETPEPGVAPQLMPIVSASNAPIYLLQPEQSPWFWKRGLTVPALERGGSDVYVRLLPGVRDRFYFRPDAVAAEETMAARLPTLLRQAARALAALPTKVRRPTTGLAAAPPVREGKRPRALRPFVGNPTPPSLTLADLQGRLHRLEDYHGQVVLVNFWASWCPPCVHEMPSMQRLADRLAGQPFHILAVNMAEPAATVQDFVRNRVQVHFPVLLDRDGAVLQRWQVFAFPTSFVLGPEGRIRYALFGATEWDNAALLRKLEALLAETAQVQ